MGVIFPLIIAIVMVVIVLLMLRSGKLREKYAVLWLVIGVVTIILGVFPALLGWVAGLLGVQVPANLLFALAIVLLAGVGLHVSRELTVLEDETRTLAEEVAILRLDLEKLQRAGSKTTDPQLHRPADGQETQESTNDD